MPEPSPTAPVDHTDEATATARGGLIALAIGVMNIATYGFTILAARALGPQQYGAVAAVMNLMLVVAVVSLALQATAARRVAAAPGDVRVIEHGIRRVTLRAALGLGGALVLLAPLTNVLLRLESLATAVVVGLIAVPLTVMGGQAGILQGERRWRPLAVLYVAAGVPRLVAGAGLLLWRPEELVAILAVLIGAVPPVLVGWWALRDRGHVDDEGSGTDHGGRALVRESLRNSQALLAFFALSNVDVIVARNVLSDHESGLYAAGLILTKAMLFLPQFVVVVAFPDMADSGARRRALRLSLALVGVLGVVGVLATYLLSGLALVFVGGSEYAEVQSQLWLFAVLGTLLSMVQLLVYALLAQEASRALLVLWAVLVVLAVAAATLAGSVTSLVVVVVAVDSLLLAALLVPALRTPRLDG
ncbi:lipopolysaccharide biosynthesis protein [Nocardioides litoris]|uniref:lipopolysaccharide biosynthesis protein n=1 Tax=Nocardioides litoris TaxID=1926648 RepID=UPI001FEBC3DB|nr:oligosaccharide flippase family protein [Nocardioides litoris]